MNKPVVFISSTIQEMRETRNLVKDFIEKELGYEVLMSESGGSRSITPIKQCKKWAKECDIFIAIIGEKYGYTIPRLGISVSELEFNEAYKDSPEKILIYVSANKKEPKQKAFEKRVTDFSKGYLRRPPYKDNSELRLGIRDDIANYFKERIDFIGAKNLRVKERTTPSIDAYITVGRKKRNEQMMIDAIDIAKQFGMNQIEHIKPDYWFAEKTINRLKILFTINIVPDNYSRDWLIRHIRVFDTYYLKKWYEDHKNRFTITLVNGNATLKSLDWLTRNRSGTCFKVEPGIYYGEGLSEEKEKHGNLHFENSLIVSKVTNKQTMNVKLSEALDWVGKESKRINFRCNYRGPLKVRLRKWKR